MTGLLICAAVVAALLSAVFLYSAGGVAAHGLLRRERIYNWVGLGLLAVALWLAYAAGGA